MLYRCIVFVRSKLLVVLTHGLALPILQIIRKPEIFPYTGVELMAFPLDSLGNDLVRFLTGKQLKLLAHYAKHDIKHILLGYDTTDKGEVCLQCFMLGNRHVSFPVLATILYGMYTMPEYWRAFITAFRRGRSCPSISDWKWFEILYQPTSVLRSWITATQ